MNFIRTKMNIIIDILEVFLPELTSSLAGPSSAPLANRFRRVGYGLIGLSILYLIGALAWCGWRQKSDCAQTALTPADFLLLSSLVLLGLVALILARNSVAHATGIATNQQDQPKDVADIPDECSADSCLELKLTREFDQSSSGFYRKKSGVPWIRMLAACQGRIALEVWEVEVKGVSLRLSLFVGQECFRLREEGGDAEVRYVVVPYVPVRMSVRLVDAQGARRDLDLIPQKSPRHPLLVFVNAMPLTFRKS